MMVGRFSGMFDGETGWPGGSVRLVMNESFRLQYMAYSA